MQFFAGFRVAAFQPFANQAMRHLTYLDLAGGLRDFAVLPGNRLEALRGDRAGCIASANRQWRICSRWEHDGPYDVEIVDYH